ncbi:phosphate/phosphite/phosphonate ABC transporter substrate-binding protein [Paenibacillus alkaliterrae]|uniref:phosphate/phosphite/phosphonate ABC transporter substrate-binding protein n=1 Tax=Paenibacillus alkaliterrae TaxID=320909 RepID=UPI001F417C96|nr:phosphate/phosphite/phosphonate ABC transporter substrate-binding protein [Paenibacillus alkaliterrae]MCF2941429.1 phosphate/phosphite/phosphonate ABC transporter substrate-binding protein [Paenibacillus alkaliterrae]
MLKKTSLQIALVITSIMIVLAGCGQKVNNGSSESGNSGTTGNAGAEEAAAATEWPEVLRIGNLPMEDGEMSRSADQFAKDLGEYLGIKVETFEGEDYNMMIEAMRSQKIDVTTYGPFGYIIAVERSGAKLLAAMNNGPGTEGTSVIIVPKDSPAQSIKDLKGKNFLFADPASTTGHLYPRATIMRELGITNDEIATYFSNVSFSGGHDKSLLAIANGDADGAATCSQCIEMIAGAGLIKAEDVRVIAESDPIAGGGALAYRGDLPADLVEKMREFALGYGEKNPEYFKAMGAAGFFPAEDADFDGVRDVAKKLNMSPEEMLK